MALEYEHLSQVRRPENQGGGISYLPSDTQMPPIRAFSSYPRLRAPTALDVQLGGRKKKVIHMHRTTFNQFPLLHTLSQILYSRHCARESTISSSGEPPDRLQSLSLLFFPPSATRSKTETRIKLSPKTGTSPDLLFQRKFVGGVCRGVCLSLWHKPLVLVE